MGFNFVLSLFISVSVSLVLFFSFVFLFLLVYLLTFVCLWGKLMVFLCGKTETVFFI